MAVPRVDIRAERVQLELHLAGRVGAVDDRERPCGARGCDEPGLFGDRPYTPPTVTRAGIDAVADALGLEPERQAIQRPDPDLAQIAPALWGLAKGGG